MASSITPNASSNIKDSTLKASEQEIMQHRGYSSESTLTSVRASSYPSPQSISTRPTCTPEQSTRSIESLKHEYLNLCKDYQIDKSNYAISDDNLFRNRYSNVLPNKATQFKIEDDLDFYFNANWVLKNQVLVSQAPLQKEINEFWEMINHANIQTIVMLTNCRERGIEKATIYWEQDIPEEILFENGREKIVKRIIEIPDGFEKTRKITQYHLQNWPDYGVVSPETLTTLVKIMLKDEGKFLVHCSAGLGRTGAFLLAYEACRTKSDQTFEIAKNLRDPQLGRVNMIQAVEQYILAYQTYRLFSES